MMHFVETPVTGAFRIVPDRHVDDRGSFARLWCREELVSRGLNGNFIQCNTAFSHRRGTLRGLHYQSAPYAEAKLVQCVRGAIFDVLVDLRPSSPSYLRWFGMELTAGGSSLLYLPEGCAHGYLTLEDESGVLYAVSAPYTPSAEGGVRWNDPLLAIEWPFEPAVISDKDRSWPDVVR